MKRTKLAFLAFLVLSCTSEPLAPESESMEPNRHATTILTLPDPFDPNDPKTPRAGHWEPLELQPVTTMNTAWPEAVQQELIGLQTAFGLPPIPDNRQLAKSFESGAAPPEATMVMVVGVDPTDIIGQVTSWYQRVAGRFVTVGYVVLWQNGKNAAPIPFGTALELELPFEANSDALTSAIHLSNSNFRNDNVLGDQYEFGVPVASRVPVRRVTGPGASVPITVGSAVVDGNMDRIVRGTFTYRTNGVRNPEWPFIIWISFPDVHQPLPNAEIIFEYDSAMLGDVIDLLDSGFLVVQSLPALVAGDVPNGKKSFTVAVADTYYVELRGVRSQGYVVD